MSPVPPPPTLPAPIAGWPRSAPVSRSGPPPRPASAALPALAALALLLAPRTEAGTLLVDFDLETGTASTSPLEIPIPGSEDTVTVTPSLELDSGSLAARFENAPAVDVVLDGPMAIESLVAFGTLALTIADTIQIGPFPIEVEAVVSGPVEVVQQSPARGALTGGAVFIGTDPGTFDLAIGPLACTDNALGVLCGVVATALGVEFPLTQSIEDVALPLAGGTFEQLDEPGLATLGNTLEISIPIDPEGGTGISFQAEFGWMESARTPVPVPEPGAAVLSGLALVLFRLIRRQRR